ncbi:MAG: hypothetical protein WAW80_04540 [Candidatus Saccharimonadales bacterium]
MSRLPTPGGDNGNWGTILNDYLSQTHNPDGTLKDGSVTSAKLADGTIVACDISATAGITETQLAGTVQASLTAADNAAPKPAAGTDGKVLQWNNTSGQLEDASTQLDNTYAPRSAITIVSPRKYGLVGNGIADDTAAIQTALNTGSDVEISDCTVKITATLRMNKAGQRLWTRNATVCPAFVGDAIQVTYAAQQVSVAFSGALQPNTGTASDYQETAAIRIGGTGSNYNPKNASVARSRIFDAWRGNGIIWEQGAHIDFSQFSIETSVTYDGIRGTPNFDDNNEGYFADTRVSNCGRYGYWFQNNAGDATKSSRTHLFLNSKAFGCNTNFLIETNTNVGEIYSENGINPDQFTSVSYANNIQYGQTVSTYASVIDNGVGNRIQGLNAFGKWDTKVDLVQNLDINALHSGRQRLTQTADYAFLDTILDTNNNVTVTHNHGGSGVRTDTFTGPVAANAGVTVTGGTLTAGLGLSMSGLFRFNYSTRTTNTSIPSNGAAMNMCDATTGALTMTLPTASVSNGTTYYFMKSDSSANTVTIAGTINGATNYVLTAQYKYVIVVGNGSGLWYVFGSN